MSQQKVDLVTLQFILNQLSEENAHDCSKIISKLLNSLSVAMFYESKTCDEKIVASVQLLLNLYEFLNPNCAKTKSELPVNTIIENLKLILQCDNENCNLPKNNVQLNIISILSSVFKHKLLQNSSRNLEELREFLDLCFYSIRTNLAKKECSSDCLIFKLKILTIIYQTEAKILCESSGVECCEKIISVNYLEESELADLVLYQDYGVAFQTLFNLIPAHVMHHKSTKVVETIWKKISASISDIKHSRVLVILCHVFDLYCDKSQQLNDKVDLAKLLFGDVNYWKLIQFSLKDKDPIKRKQGLYLLKKSVDLLNSENRSISCLNEKYTFYWHLDCSDELYKIYSEIIIILEFLEEQQFHIIKPIFKLVETVSKKIIYSEKMDFSWILVIFTKMLMHESLQVVKLGLTNLLKLPENFFADENIARESADLLALHLNNLSLYFNGGLIISHQLEDFFRSISDLNTSKIFFITFIKKVCSQVWSAEALFFVIHSLPSLSVKDLCFNHRYALWGKEIISELTAFVLKAFKTHNKIIQTGVQTKLLNTCLNLTDEKDVTLENFIFLISIFFEREIVKIGSKSWDHLIFMLNNSYSEEDGRSILEKYSVDKLGKKATFMSSMLILFHYAYDPDVFEMASDLESLESHDRKMFFLNYFQDILLLYKEIHKRPYCEKLMYDENLSIICNVYQFNLRNSMPSFVMPTLHFLKDVIWYIQIQLPQISGLQDLKVIELYLKTFECITKTLRLYKCDIEYVNNLYTKVLKDLEYNSNICSVGMFWRFRLLNILLTLNCLKLDTCFLNSYLPKAVNEPLKKDNSYSDKTRDLLTLWGRMNSEYLEQKWKILEHLINNKSLSYGRVKNESGCWLSSDDLARLCTEALNIEDYGALSPVMSILTDLLPVMGNDTEVKVIINLVWKLILERKKSEEFKFLFRKFVEMVFQEAFIDAESMKEILSEYANLIISNSSLAMVNIFMKHAQRIELTKSVPLFCLIVGKGLIFGSVEKKDERLTKTVYSHLQYYELCDVQEIGDYDTSNEIRARAVQKILQLDKNCALHQAIARELIVTLLKMENELNKNRTRYFGNTHVHRVKHRLIQALLLLEPILSPNEDQAVELSKWLIHSLISENLQPSVRYMQEWLLIRIIIRHSKAYACFNINYYYFDSEEIKKKGLCSLIAVLYHFCPLINFDLMQLRITSDLDSILYFCFHQHSELRTYAQVVFANFYQNFKEIKCFNKTIQPYENVYEALKTFILEECKRNKNLQMLMNNFYLNGFHPLKNYSLETIYNDLPKLADIGSDEWISVKLFEYCGVKSSETNVPLKDSYPLKFLVQDIFKYTFESSTPQDCDDMKSENYQKKIIPLKPLMPSWNDDNSCRSTVGREGLIVVASLIDRVPNLGGLARTCEVFGASEYVINSLKHTADKQFTSLSVTAEKWLTIKEVKIQHLLDYVSQMKQDGYTIIGAEQALYSQPLNAVKFPKKSLLLLGNEREGIPPNLLPFLDICVEIPQIGLIRSLNVHVTGALFIWEYAKQHHFP